MGEFNSTSTYSLVDFIFIGLNDKFIRENRDIDESIMLDEQFIFSNQSSDLKTENLSVDELYQLISYKQLKTDRMQQQFTYHPMQ